MSSVLVVIGTSHFDLHDLCDALKDRGVECTTRHWNAIADPPGRYDLAVLFGLTEHMASADRYARTVRSAIGEETPLLIVSSWSPATMAPYMREKYRAEYVLRHGPIAHLLDKVLGMMPQAKTAP